MIKFKPFFLSLLTLFCFALASSAQETQIRVVDEVVAQVNNSVITLSGVRRETKNAVDSLVQEGKKRDEAQKMVDERQGELIANLINEQLLVDKAKDLGLDRDIETLVNQRLTDIMKQIGAKTVEAVYTEMERNGLNPNDIKENWRKQFIKDEVIRREVQATVYWRFNGKELQDYYEKHKDKFTKPETISFSELFLGFAGRDEMAVREKAKQLVELVRGGADFVKLQKDNSDAGAVTQGAGKVERVKVADLPEIVRTAVGARKTGDVTNPFEIKDMGMVILKVDEREQASSESVYNEPAVRLAMMSERFPDEAKKYMAKLRKEGYIEIREAYRPLVSPVLYADERAEKPGVSETKIDTSKTEPDAAKTKSETSKGNGNKPKPDRKN